MTVPDVTVPAVTGPAVTGPAVTGPATARARRSRGAVPWIAVVAVAAVVVAGAVLLHRRSHTPTKTITVEFTSAPGLYRGNLVKVLGIPVGKVTSVRGNPQGARAVLSVRRDLALPADVEAMLVAPALISDRYVALGPAYTGGPQLAPGATIGPRHTAVSLSVDQILDTVNRLAIALGPAGANADGALSGLVSSLAHTFGGQGPALNGTLDSLGQGLQGLAGNGPQLTALLDGLGTLTTTASHNLEQYRAFTSDLAAVSTSLAADDGDLGTALSTLQSALAQLSAFVTTNRSALTGTVSSLATFADTLSAQQGSLARTFRTLPVALANLEAAYDPDAPGGPALTARYDPVADSAAFSTAVCGNSIVRLLTVALATAANPDPKAGEDLLCGLNGVAAQLPLPPGGATGPDLSISSLVGGGR